ncbi:MAG: RNA polymerase sigma factor, partial [Opitutaceae bacterium]|nr:RNA polymerase sigma factor [Cytophagales bacterium]
MVNNEVIEKAIKGDVKAFKGIFDYYLPKMRPVCRRYSETDDEADDVLQEAFIKVYYNLKSFKFEGSFEGWIRKTVVNTALNNIKQRKRNLNFLSIENISEENEVELNPSDIDNLEQDQLLKIIKELPDGYKTVFTLYVLDDFSHKEIGAMLGISEGSTRSQYSKAKKM